ncbi:MAG: hypothetical protein PHI86_08015 [Candidatus Omnitrophica bacterium]|nr:hypothetical protein [Candidatus Omnitrophota bacterium]
MDEETIVAPEEISSPLNFKDKDGRIYSLSPTTYKHIKRDHCIQDPCNFIKDTLLDPIAIIEDKTKKDRWIYHRDYKNNFYKVVVTCLTDRKIKTAFISDEIKGGKATWINKKNLIQ